MFYSMQYNRVIWGLVFTLVDIRIGHVDIIPDFIGYLLITMGLSELADQHEFYEKAKSFCQWLILLSIPDVYNYMSNSFIDFLLLNTEPVFILISSIGAIIKIFTAYYICRAVIELSRSKNISFLQKQAGFTLKFYTAVSVVLLLCIVAFELNLLAYSGTLIYIWVAATAIAEIILISLVYRSKKQLT